MDLVVTVYRITTTFPKDHSRLLDSCNAIAKMLGGLIRSLRKRLASGAGARKISPDS